LTEGSEAKYPGQGETGKQMCEIKGKKEKPTQERKKKTKKV